MESLPSLLPWGGLALCLLQQPPWLTAGLLVTWLLLASPDRARNTVRIIYTATASVRKARRGVEEVRRSAKAVPWDMVLSIEFREE